jgi:hypothetical protein
MDPSTDPDDYCGGFTHQVVYDSGAWDGYVVYDSDGNVDLTDVAPTDQTTMDSLFVVDNVALTVSMTNTIASTWIGTHTFKIRATNGVYLYADSATFDIEFYNPCEDTVVDCGATIATMENSIRSGSAVTDSYSNCGDTVSTGLASTSFATANKFICGERLHYLRIANSNAVNYPNTYTSVFPYMTYTWTYGPDPSMDDDRETFGLSMESDEMSQYGEYSFEIVVDLPQWPTSTSDLVTFTAILDPCIVTSYEAPSNLTHIYTIGDNENFIEFTYAQAPCSYEATYTYTYVNHTEIPDWLQPDDAREPVLPIYTKNLTANDFYELWVTATLDNLYNWDVLDNALDTCKTDDPVVSNRCNDYLDYLSGRMWDPDNPPTNLVYTNSFMINVTVELAEVGEFEVSNTPPFLRPTPQDLIMTAGEYFEYDFNEPQDS